MKEHFWLAEKSTITYQGECSWCGEKEALAQPEQDEDAIIIQYHEATIKRLEKRIEELLASPPQRTEQEPCAKHCEATAFEIVIKNLQGEIERMKTAQRTWVGLTDDEVKLYWDWEDFQCGCGPSTLFAMVRDIEARLKDRNI
jgi:hypothetical protein